MVGHFAGQDGVPMPVKTDDFWLLSRAWSTPAGLVRGAQVVFRAIGSAARRRKAVGMGAALASSFLAVALKQGTQVWLSAPVEELIVAGDGSFLRHNLNFTRQRMSWGRFLSAPVSGYAIPRHLAVCRHY